MKPSHFRFIRSLALFALVVFPKMSYAQNCTGISEVMGNDMIVSQGEPGGDVTFFTLGPVLYSLWNDSGTLPVQHDRGDIKQVWQAATLMHELGHNLNLRHDGTVTTANAMPALFVTSDNGRLYKIDPQTFTALASTDIRRPCCPKDKITATPAVQLYQLSNAAFQSAMLARRGYPDDLVFVVTHHDADDTGNQLIALYASDLTPCWTFNASGTYSMSYAADGCEVDYSTNTVYCGTNQAMAGQSTVWALDALPSGASGSLKWSANAGSITNRPMLASGKLYVTPSGSIQCFDAASGSTLWTLPTGSPVVRNIVVEPRGTQPTRIYYTTADGSLHGTMDNFPSPVPLWPPVSPPTGIKFSTMPALVTATGKLLTGRSDGSIQQVAADTGSPETTVPVGTPGTLWDPKIDYSSSTGNPVLNETTTEGSLYRYCIPVGTTGVGPSPSVSEIALAQNAPNPFSTHTRIEYRLPEAAQVEIDIFAIDGRVVRRLVHEKQSAGSHDAAWDGRDDGGRAVAAGPYFYRMRVGGADGRTLESSKKIQLVR